ncbi:MAG: hypothetical protein CBC05_10660 [Crocinitomicaceae bacterium TMED45]|nr:MAG: hypothetical protein CBC05_10660 [Crocinitomicaceae bacterium TMED45]
MSCIHNYSNRPSEERFNGCELFFPSAVPPPNPKPFFILMKHFFTLIAAAMTFMVSGWSQTVVDIVVDSEDHTVLEAAVVEAGLVETLQGEGPFTVFAPTDAAFTALLTALNVEAADLLGLPQLGDILTYHVAGVEAMSSDLSDGQMVTTINGQDVTISIVGETVTINGSATVTVANIDATNGVVHVIDAVLVPAIVNGCTDMMACNYSLVANTDDGSCVLPGDMCDDGDDATVNDMVGEDCVCAGIPATVVDIVVNSEDHTLLEAAVIAAGLVEALSAEGPFTVFAPTDAAITALVEALEITAEDLLALPDLGEILQYHVVAGAAMSGDLTDGQEIETLLGENVTVTINADGVFINDAQVTAADIEAGNGVVHVIDAVLLPPAPETNTVVDVIVNSEDHTLLEAAVIEAGLVEVLSSEGPFTVFAPTDSAITVLVAALEITAEDLLALPNLSEILKYHVVAGAAMSGDLTDGQEIETLLGSNVTVTINAEGVFINDAQVTVADIEADNGVVHVIDAVLLPPTPDGINEATATWSVMPNPAKDVVTLTGVNPSATLALLDMTGRTVREFAQGTTVLTVGDLTPGTYMLTVNDGRNLELKKIMVQ